MSKLKRVFDLVFDKNYRFLFLARRGFYDSLCDREYMMRASNASIGYTPNIDNPVTFNDKLAWLKLNDRNPLYTKLVDKYAVRGFVEERLGADYLIPLVGGPWKSANDIDFESLPTQFVLKCTHDSGGVLVCKDKSSFDMNQARRVLSKHLSRNFFYMNREWPYKDVVPQIIAEAYMHEDSKADCDQSGNVVTVDCLQSKYGLLDYKVTCFNGKARLFMIFVGVISGDSKSEEYFENVYDEEFNILDISDCVPHAAPRYGREIAKPEVFEKMIKIAEHVSENLPISRVDFYYVEGQVKLGEITLYPDGGMTSYKPDSWNETLGSWLQLPERI